MNNGQTTQKSRKKVTQMDLRRDFATKNKLDQNGRESGVDSSLHRHGRNLFVTFRAADAATRRIVYNNELAHMILL